jgi:hypothetical protein
MQTRSMTRKARFKKFFNTAPSDLITEILDFAECKNVFLCKTHIVNNHMYDRFLLSNSTFYYLHKNLYMSSFLLWYKNKVKAIK